MVKRSRVDDQDEGAEKKAKVLPKKGVCAVPECGKVSSHQDCCSVSI